MTYVLGIDPSLTQTGIATVSECGYKVTSIKTKSATPLAKRLAIISDDVASWCLPVPALVCIERPFGGGRAATAAAAPVLGAAYGAVLLGLHDALEGTETPCLVVPPTVRAKYATGKGNASKDDVLAAAIRRFGYEGSNNNEADALIFAWIAAEVEFKMLVGKTLCDEYSGELPAYPYPQLPQAHYDPIDKWEDWERVL